MFPISGIEAIPLRRVLDMHHLKTSGVYCIMSPTGKKYIGQSRNMHRRIRAYLYNNCHCQKALYNSLIKHGSEQHYFCVIEFCKPDKMNDIEQFYIGMYSTTKELNITTGGKNFHHSMESRQSMSRNQKNVVRNIGMKHSPEVRRRMSEAKKRIPLHPNSLNALAESRSRAFAASAIAQSKEVFLIKDMVVLEFASRLSAAEYLGTYRENIYRSHVVGKLINGYKIVL
jgi:group I intron endonuclease